jgi:hypothetical protein
VTRWIVIQRMFSEANRIRAVKGKDLIEQRASWTVCSGEESKKWPRVLTGNGRVEIIRSASWTRSI